MKTILILIGLLYTGLPSFSQTTKTTTYFPPPEKWEKRNPVEFGFDTAKLNAAIRFAIESESKNPRSMEESHNRSFAKEPFGEAVGPFADRGDQTGIIIYKGYIIT